MTPETAQDWRTSAASNQPQRRLRPVTVPNSRPRVAQPLADLVVELGRERARADPGGIGLDDAEHEAGCRGAEPGAGGGGAGDGVGRGDERIGAVIDVEQHALRALEQDAAAASARLVQRHPHRAGELQHELGDLAEVALEPAAVDDFPAEACAERVVMGADAVELRSERAEMGEVADPDRAAADLVLIGRADAAPRGADLAGPRGVLAQRVEIAVEGQDQRAGVGDLQRLRADRDALAGQPSDLGRSAQGSSTTPLPITESVPRTMPEGSKESL